MYQQIARFGQLLFSRAFLFRVGFNLSPMYRRSCGRVIEVSPDLLQVKIRLRYSYKNKNYVGSIFGGSLFSSVDPFPKIALLVETLKTKCAEILQIPKEKVHVNLLEINAKWVMEGGHVMPDPGEEDEWMAKVTKALEEREKQSIS